MVARPERFKSYLFADQSLDELMASMSPPGGELAEAVARLRDGNPGEAEVILGSLAMARPDELTGWHRLVLAGARLRRGNRDGAISALRQAAGAPESRIKLWAWTALRELGVAPETDRVLGVVVEVETGRGVDTLAAYDDDGARYLLHTGAKVVWDSPDTRMLAEIRAVLAVAQPLAAALPPGKLAGAPGPGQTRFTLLSTSGPRAVEEPLADAAGAVSPRAALFAAATALLEKILAIVKW